MNYTFNTYFTSKRCVAIRDESSESLNNTLGLKRGRSKTLRATKGPTYDALAISFVAVLPCLFLRPVLATNPYLISS